MLKVGDKVVYTKDDISLRYHLKIGNLYTIDNIFYDYTLSVEEDEYVYPDDCFKLDTKYYRRKKLKKLYGIQSR